MTYKPEKGSRQPVVLYDKDNKAIDVSGIEELSSIKIDTGEIAGDLKLVKDNQGRLYGKYGEAWIPVKVDSEGRPIISQGPAGTEPWPVQLSGTIPVIYISRLEDRPSATEVEIGQFVILTDEELSTWVSNGVNWVEVL